ncbi:unnamed protein product [Amoebophrya sp. A25]|nr:unnamed protein product [Amoebophrya sp. A25]|eukprot:GSA25T00019347001.1
MCEGRASGASDTFDYMIHLCDLSLSDYLMGENSAEHHIGYVPGIKSSPSECGRICALMEPVCEGFIVGHKDKTAEKEDRVGYCFLLRDLGADRRGPRPAVGEGQAFAHREDTSKNAAFFRLTATTRDGERCGDKFRVAWMCTCENGHAADSRDESCSVPGATKCRECYYGYSLSEGNCERDAAIALAFDSLDEDVEVDEDEVRVTSVITPKGDDEQDVAQLDMTQVLIMVGACTGISLLAGCAYLGAQ